MGGAGSRSRFAENKLALSKFTEKIIAISRFTKKKKKHFCITPKDSALLDANFIIRTLGVLRVGKRNPRTTGRGITYYHDHIILLITLEINRKHTQNHGSRPIKYSDAILSHFTENSFGESRFMASTEMTIYEKKKKKTTSHVTFHGKKFSPFVNHENTLYHPLTCGLFPPSLTAIKIIDKVIVLSYLITFLILLFKKRYESYNKSVFIFLRYC